MSRWARVAAIVVAAQLHSSRSAKPRRYPPSRNSEEPFNNSPLTTSVALYGVAENFVHFLMHHEKGKYRARFLEFLATYGRSYAGEKIPGRIARLEKLLGTPLGQLQKECDAYTATRSE